MLGQHFSNRDRENLKWLLNQDSTTLQQWWDNISVDDREYAYELIVGAREELQATSNILYSLDSIDKYIETDDLIQARAVIDIIKSR